MYGANSGTKSLTLSQSRSLPRSTRIITEVAVATGFVIEARSKIMSTVMGFGSGSHWLWPKALR